MATQTRNPTSDEAASGTLSGAAGTRWTLVDDYPDTTGADILSFGTAAASITFGFAAFAIPAGSTAISVQVRYHDGEAATGANNCAGRLKVGGAYFNAATHNPSGTTYTARSDNFANNPQTAAAWTVDQVNGIGANALQAFGIGSTDSNPAFRVSGVQIQVTYTAPSSNGSGSSTIGAATSNGAGATHATGSGSSTIAPATSSGTATNRVTSTAGSSTIAAATSSGTGTTGGASPITGSGSSTIAPATSAGAGAVHIGGAGSSTIAAPTSGGAAAVRSSGAGSSTIAGATSSGAGDLIATGSGSSSAGAATSSGAGATRITGAGSGSIAAATSSGTGSTTDAPTSTGSGSSTISPVTSSGAGTVRIAGSGSGSIAPATSGTPATASIDGATASFVTERQPGATSGTEPRASASIMVVARARARLVE